MITPPLPGSRGAQLLQSLGASKLGPLPSPHSEAKETGAAPELPSPVLPELCSASWPMATIHQPHQLS